jgi:hypothetical protein
MVPQDDMHFWLWVITVATAVAGGLLALWGSSLQRRQAATESDRGAGFRVMLASYVFMTLSMVTFAARGFL